MKIYENPPVGEWDALMSRRLGDDESVKAVVASIIDRVAREGDRAVCELTEAIDGVRLVGSGAAGVAARCGTAGVAAGCGIEAEGAAGEQSSQKLAGAFGMEVSTAEFKAAEAAVSEQIKTAIEDAAENIRKFHAAQLPDTIEVETAPGVRCVQRPVPLQKVGLYVPGGSAPLFSTVLMLGIPARVAGCGEIVLCTPPRRDGTIAPEVLYAASVCGIDKVLRVGGAQAIAAMAYGTETIPRVDKIFGPGNRYVMAAKQIVGASQVGIDMPAGPSEVMVMADGTARHEFVAADLLSQVEHGPDSQAVLLCLTADFAASVRTSVQQQVAALPRQEIALKALENSRLIVLDSLQTMIDFANRYAAEHLILSVEDPWKVAEQITAAGSIFLGNYSPESAGDYASGTNHTLPTSGWVRSCSGVNTDSFFRKITIQKLSAEGLQGLGGTIMSMASAEGLDAHRRAVEVRLAALAAEKSATQNASSAALSDSAALAADSPAAQTALSSAADIAAEQAAGMRAIERLMRGNIRSLTPYSTARDEFDGIPDVCLDANENPFNNGFNRYPDPHQRQLKATISRIKGVPADRIFIGNGSDEAIDLAFRVFCRPGVDNAVAIAPTYGMYKVAAEINDIQYRSVQLREDFSLDEEALLAATDRRTKLIFICSPNNPTGNSFPKEQIESIIRRFNGIVVLDEAYIDFSVSAGLLGDLDRFPNLVILQTMSKAHGMAGLRVGMAFARERIIDAFSRVKYPYNINGLTQDIVRQRLETTAAQSAAAGTQQVAAQGQQAGAASQSAASGAASVVTSGTQSGIAGGPQAGGGTPSATPPAPQTSAVSEAQTAASCVPAAAKAPQAGTIVKERGRLEQALRTCPLVLRIYPSDANFLLVKVTDPEAIYNALVAEGIIVRDRSRVKGCEGSLRITVGTRRENDRLMIVLTRLAAQAATPIAGQDAASSAAQAAPRERRCATVFRSTNETQITVMIDLDGAGPTYISTGIGFFDHMLDQLVHHGGMSLLVDARGDLQVDEHHTIEDVAITLGEAFTKALGSKAGIGRYGFVLPMDESEAKVLIDLGGRIDFSWDASFQREKIGDMPTEMFRHFFKSFSESARCNLHISATGENEHHKIEGIFKAFARALRSAAALTAPATELPSSKGVLF